MTRLRYSGAGNRDRTGDLKITNLALYQLSYPGLPWPRTTELAGSAARSGHTEFMERETGIEPATNSLEGCDSTTELLPPLPSLQLLFLVAAVQTPQRLAPVIHPSPQRKHSNHCHRDQLDFPVRQRLPGQQFKNCKDHHGYSKSRHSQLPDPGNSFANHRIQFWCTGEDSNLRSSWERQIYSLLPLTTRPPVQT